MTAPLTALTLYYQRLADIGEVPAFGYSTEGIGFALVLDPDGTPRMVMDLRHAEGKKLRSRPMTVPQSSKRPGTTPRAFFLWDNSKYVFGLGRDPATGLRKAFPAHADAFRDRHRTLLAGCDDAGLAAVLGFLARWTPDAFAAPPFTDEMLDQNIVFRLDGDSHGPAPRFIHDRPAARPLWERALAEAAGETRPCLVTGTAGPIARLHPAIKNVWGAQSSGASLVSFNQPAFLSYGKDQGDNAPVSEAAAFGYGTALNTLLRGGSRNRVQIGDASVVFWADARHQDEDAATRAEKVAAALIDPDRARETGQDARLHDVLDGVGAGRPGRDIAADLDLDPDMGFHILGLAPNAARLSVRFWHETSLGPLVDRIGEHWRDLHIKPFPWGRPPSVWQLLLETAVFEKAENVPPQLGGEVMRAILTGARYPRTLLATALQRIRANGQIDRRAALCKAWLARDARMREKEYPGALPLDPARVRGTLDPFPDREDWLVSLDREEINAAYRLGRLFSVLERVQYLALGRVNAGIRDRYFSAASATPASIFPLLLRGAHPHLAVLRKDRKTGGLAQWLEREIGEIVDRLPMTLPRHLRLEDQGRFVVGYYHQRNARKADADAPQTDTTETDTTETGE